MKEALFIVSLLICNSLTAQPYKYLIMEGGGIRGATYAGAIKVLEEKKITDGLEGVGGTSAGALVGGLLAVGYNADELRDILNGLLLQEFNDGRVGFIGGAVRMGKNYGWFRGVAMEAWLGRLIAAKTGNANLTLSQLHTLAATSPKFKDLYALATNLSLQRQEVLYYGTYPSMPVKTAIRASISIPLYYGAMFLDSNGNAYRKQSKDKSRQVLVDGGVVANYPLTLFDSNGVNMKTLGLKLERPEQIEYTKDGLAPYHITNFSYYISALYNVTIETLNKATSPESERARTIYISTGHIGGRVKKVSKVQKDLMYNNGKTAAEKFFSNK
ncbi:patatin-like phospholipase family protein [Polluticoccus soli]|uniref:patatin-like phospholipase family protein n=1 Tax=Polluticoccus soli TaxID=3034150 RepID=UPI0023E1C45D|nr:patatin-like phospholipase family protein [Flavipsychrobacter sp. JY13-12]